MSALIVVERAYVRDTAAAPLSVNISNTVVSYDPAAVKPRWRPWRVGKFKRTVTARYWRRVAIAIKRHFEAKNKPIQARPAHPRSRGARRVGIGPQRGARTPRVGELQRSPDYREDGKRAWRRKRVLY